MVLGIFHDFWQLVEFAQILYFFNQYYRSQNYCYNIALPMQVDQSLTKSNQKDIQSMVLGMFHDFWQLVEFAPILYFFNQYYRSQNYCFNIASSMQVDQLLAKSNQKDIQSMVLGIFHDFWQLVEFAQILYFFNQYYRSQNYCYNIALPVQVDQLLAKSNQKDIQSMVLGIFHDFWQLVVFAQILYFFNQYYRSQNYCYNIALPVLVDQLLAKSNQKDIQSMVLGIFHDFWKLVVFAQILYFFNQCIDAELLF